MRARVRRDFGVSLAALRDCTFYVRAKLLRCNIDPLYPRNRFAAKELRASINFGGKAKP